MLELNYFKATEFLNITMAVDMYGIYQEGLGTISSLSGSLRQGAQKRTRDITTGRRNSGLN